MKPNKKRRLEAKKKRDEEWASYLRKKQKHPTKLRTGRNRPGHQDFSEVTTSYRKKEEE
jgi:hypothetical protein